jgi:hypothetical protein
LFSKARSIQASSIIPQPAAFKRDNWRKFIVEKGGGEMAVKGKRLLRIEAEVCNTLTAQYQGVEEVEKN